MQSTVHIHDGIATNGSGVRSFFKMHQDGPYLITTKSLKRRTLPQNDYLHVIFTMLVEPLRDAGWENIRTMEDAKEFVKSLFLTVSITNEKTGEVIKRVKHTSELNKEEAMIFIDDIKRWSAEYLNFFIPDPEQQTQLFTCHK